MTVAGNTHPTGKRSWDPDFSRHRPTLWALGLGGLIPFVVFAALLLYAGNRLIAFDLLVRIFAGYSAVILSFLGGIRWGASLMTPTSGRGTLVASVVPALFGWVLLLVPTPWCFAGFAVAFLGQGAWDVFAIRRGALPHYFGKLRIVLTAVVVLAQAASFFATSGGASAA